MGQITSSLVEEDFDLPLGSVIPRKGQPLQLDTVIYDLTQNPIWSNSAIRAALDQLFSLLPKLHVHSLAMPALAYRHGKIPVVDFIRLMGDYLEHRALPWSGEIWLLLPRSSLQAALGQLQQLCDKQQP
jgi:hypothetical protein